MRSNYRRKRAPARESGNFWLSFSDMMSVLVLVFIFVIFSMMLSLAQQKEQLAVIEEEYAVALLQMNESEKALEEKEQQLIVLTDEVEGQKLILAKQEEELKEQENLLKEQEKEHQDRVILLDAEKSQLDALLKDAEAKLELLGDQEEKLASSQALVLTLTSELEQANEENENLSRRLLLLQNNDRNYQNQIDQLLLQIEEKKKELESLNSDYESLEGIFAVSQTELSEAKEEIRTKDDQLSVYRDELAQTQEELERMVGVKAQIIEKLSVELDRNNIVVSVDEQTGAIALPSEMLFAVGANWLSLEGRECLDEFLPVYLNVLLSEEFRPYIAEIIIEGHTDSSGKAGEDPYLYNLGLSQERALSVSEYVLKMGYMQNTLGLSQTEMRMLRDLITASGRSYSALKYDANGREDKAASRRVEIKFRLKDEETVAATEALLRLMGSE